MRSKHAFRSVVGMLAAEWMEKLYFCSPSEYFSVFLIV